MGFQGAREGAVTCSQCSRVSFPCRRGTACPPVGPLQRLRPYSPLSGVFSNAWLQLWSQLRIRVICEGSEGITLTGACLPGLTWTTSPPHLLYVWVGQSKNQGVWSLDCVEMVLRHHSTHWFILTRHARRACPPSFKESQKIPAGTQSSPGQEKSITLFWRLARVTGDGPGHSDSAPAWVGQAGLWPAPVFQRERHHISPACLSNISNSWPLVHPS